MTNTAVNLKETRSRFGMPEEYAGYEVRDPEGRKIGRVKELFVNVHAEPEYVRVRTGVLGLKTFLIPIGFVAVDEERRTLTLQ